MNGSLKYWLWKYLFFPLIFFNAVLVLKSFETPGRVVCPGGYRNVGGHGGRKRKRRPLSVFSAFSDTAIANDSERLLSLSLALSTTLASARALVELGLYILASCCPG